MAIAACMPSALADFLVTDTSYYEFLGVSPNCGVCMIHKDKKKKSQEC